MKPQMQKLKTKLLLISIHNYVFIENKYQYSANKKESYLKLYEIMLFRNIKIVFEFLDISNHKVQGSNPAGGKIQLMTVRCFIAQSLSLSLFHCLNIT